jgi:hypothetical protein
MPHIINWYVYGYFEYQDGTYSIQVSETDYFDDMNNYGLYLYGEGMYITTLNAW